MHLLSSVQRFVSLAGWHARDDMRAAFVQTESPEQSAAAAAALSPLSPGPGPFDPTPLADVADVETRSAPAAALENQLASDALLDTVFESDADVAISHEDGYLLMQSLVEPVAQPQQPASQPETAIELEPVA